MSLEPETLFHGVAILTCFAWSLSFHSGGGCGGATLPPALAYKLYLTREGTEHYDRHRPIPSQCIGRCDLRLPFQGGEALEAGDLPLC
jgi:hypothetical protein